MVEEQNKYQESVDREEQVDIEKPKLSLEPEEPLVPEKRAVEKPREGISDVPKKAEPKIEAPPVAAKIEKPKAPPQEGAPPAPPTPDISGKKEDWVQKLKNTEGDERMKALGNLALERDLDFARGVAYQLGPDVINDFHRLVTGKLRQKLIDAGKLKEL